MSPRCALLLVSLLLLLRPVTSLRRVGALRDIRRKSRKRRADLPPELTVNQAQPNSTGNTTSFIQVREKHQQLLRHTEPSRFVKQEAKATTTIKQQQQQQQPRFPHQNQHDWKLQRQHFNKKRQQLEPAVLQQQRFYTRGQLSSTSVTASAGSRSMRDGKRTSRGSGPKSEKDTTLHSSVSVPAVGVPSLLRTVENHLAEADRASSFVHAATRAAQPDAVPAKPSTGEISLAPAAAAATVATQQKAATEAALQQQALAAAAQQQAAATVAQQQQQLQAAQAQQQAAAAAAAQAQQQLAAAQAQQQQAAAAERQREAILAAALPQAEQETAAELAKVSQALGVPPVTVVVTPSMAAAAAAQAGQPLTSEQVLAIQTAAEAHAAEQLREAVSTATAVGAAAAAAAPNSQKKQATSAVGAQSRSMTVATHKAHKQVRSIILFLFVTVWLI